MEVTTIDKIWGSAVSLGTATAISVFNFLYKRNLTVAMYSLLFSIVLFIIYFYFFNIRTLDSKLREKEQEIKLSYESKVNDLNEKIKTLLIEKNTVVQENIKYREQIFQLTEQQHLLQFSEIVKNFQSTQQELKEHFKTYNKE